MLRLQAPGRVKKVFWHYDPKLVHPERLRPLLTRSERRAHDLFIKSLFVSTNLPNPKSPNQFTMSQKKQNTKRNQELLLNGFGVHGYQGGPLKFTFQVGLRCVWCILTSTVGKYSDLSSNPLDFPPGVMICRCSFGLCSCRRSACRQNQLCLWQDEPVQAVC